MKQIQHQQSASNQTEQLYLGIDGGGSKCRSQLHSSDKTLLGCGISGRANPVHGLDITIESVTESALLAIEDAGLCSDCLGQTIAGIGLAGVNLPSLYKQVSDWKHPFKEMFLTTDLHIACLGAHDYSDGSVIITGTGSCGISFHDNESTILGAHGFLLGDQGSGSWYGLQAISAVLLAHDSLGPKSILSDAICSQLGVDLGSISERMANQPPKEFARLAPLVFLCADKGDTVAINIIKEGCGYINDLANALLKINPNRLSILGGLKDKITPWLDSSVQAKLVEPIHSPEYGAVALAMLNMQQRASA